MEEQFKVYPTVSKDGYPIEHMSVAYLKETIEFVERTGINSEYLPTLKSELRKKQGIIFTPIINNKIKK